MAAKKKTQKQQLDDFVKENARKDLRTVEEIKKSAAELKKRITDQRSPELKFPVRSLSNVSYSPKKGVFEIGRTKKTRTLTVATVKTFAQTMRMMALSKEQIQTNNFSTKREAYYISKNWGEAGFKAQEESDTVMDDIEAMFSQSDVSREQLRFIPEEHGGAVAGRLIVIDPDPRTATVERIDCTRFGSGAYSIPSSVEQLSFETRAKFILVIETGGMFQRLHAHRYWDTANCIIVSMSGVPTRATRRFVRKLSDEAKIPVYAFVDCDPYGIANIYRTLKVGSGNAAHLNRFFCVPQCHYLGITPEDIRRYDLPTHPLKEVDKKRAEDALKNDPFFRHHPRWQAAIRDLLRMDVRAEQQALAKHGLNTVFETYLPEKLAEVSKFLP